MQPRSNKSYSSVGLALAAAVLFGASTPAAKALLGELPPALLAGILYLGSGVGLLGYRVVRDRGWQAVNLSKTEIPWWVGAILSGGILAPLLLLIGLAQTAASTASLLLNLETVLTAVIAWNVFHEYAGRRVVFGMVSIVAGGVVLAWHATAQHDTPLGMICIAGACLCWAIDNNFTRKVSANDSLFLAGSKGLAAGIVNTTLAISFGAALPRWQMVGAAMLVGLIGYGVSLVFFVQALRSIGAARTGAYFATAPFIGALVAIFILGEPAQPTLWLAGGLMLCGVLLHVTEHHDHAHTHVAMSHAHSHRHDDHHRHTHDFPWNGDEPHTHAHRHEPIEHSHPHFPDIHHQHRHE